MRINQHKLRNDPAYLWYVLKSMFGIESTKEGDDRAVEVLTKARNYESKDDGQPRTN